MKKTPLLAVAAVISSLFGSVAAHADEDAQSALIKKGQYLAIAADCEACHRPAEESGQPFSGGYTISSPMGDIVASNITPSKQFGIGNWTEQQFADAVRKGINAEGQHLYPAMPYTAYQSLTDEDIHALYRYFMQGVKAVDVAPSKQTDLQFPFNFRQLMWGWNLLFTDSKPFQPDSNRSETLNRGKYLVDALAHCGTCHTPRNFLMAEKSSAYLSGGSLGGWYAPNITSDKNSGIGSWSEDDIVNYLKNGHVDDKAQAAGPMAEAVEHSFRKMSDSDLHAMAAWIKQVPAIATPTAKRNTESLPAVPDINQVVSGQTTQAALADSSTTEGADLYNGACASCHGIEGHGTSDHFYPSLRKNSAVTSATADNLIMAITEGVKRQGKDLAVEMPAFATQMNDAQIASVAQYVRQHFAGIDEKITADQVKNLRKGGESPFIVKFALPLFFAAVIISLAIIFLIWRKLRRKNTSR